MWQYNGIELSSVTLKKEKSRIHGLKKLFILANHYSVASTANKLVSFIYSTKE